VLEQFLNHIRKNQLIQPADKVLLAVSGGVDSMVMFDLFTKAQIPFAVAHCNFGLRGEESDGDEAFVKQYCKNFGVRCHVERFNTEGYALEQGLSIQVAARDLRYNFFRRVAGMEGYHAVATAHHHDDNLETVLLNFVRGTGIDGLTGIPIRNDIFIRPLLFARRDEILDYAKAKNIVWREDSSNAEAHYKRNLVRLHVIPLLKQINPHFVDTFSDTLDRLKGAKELTDLAVQEFSSRSLRVTDGKCRIEIDALKSYTYPEVLLWTLIKEFNFNFQQSGQIVKDHQPGKIFLSPTHRLIVDRNWLIVEKISPDESVDVVIKSVDQQVIWRSMALHFNVSDAHEHKLLSDSRVAQLDLSKIAWPLTLRKWKAGDVLVPIGMRGKKKVSDLLIDHKIPLNEKDNVAVIESGGSIIWVIGIRISELYRIDKDTQKVLIISALST